jgi:hypothetical protein
MFPRFLALRLLYVSGRSIAVENQTFSGGPVEIEFNPPRCTVQFTLGALLHAVHGSFRVKSGRVRFDPDSGQASGQIAVDVRSGETGDAGRDRQMHESVLESDRFPDAIFSLAQVKGRVASNGGSEIELRGLLRSRRRASDDDSGQGENPKWPRDNYREVYGAVCCLGNERPKQSSAPGG